MSELKLHQLSDGYRYNSDSLFLYQFLSKSSCKGEILDVGAGCGVLGLLVKRDFPKCSVSLLDFQGQNVELCRKNAEINRLDVEVHESEFLEFVSGKKYDFIISNPPFYKENIKKTTNIHLAKSRYNNNLPFDSFAKKSYNLLKDKGYLCFCYDASQVVSVFCVLQKENFSVGDVRFVHSKKDKVASLVLILARKNAKNLAKILPPLTASDENGYTDEAKKAFHLANTLSI